MSRIRCERSQIFAAVALLASTAAAAPLSVAHGGMLLTGADAPVEGTRTVSFALWSDPVSVDPTQKVWLSGNCDLTFGAGRYSTLLGAGLAGCGTALDTTHFPVGSSRFLEVRVDGVTLLPRLRIEPVPAAREAWNTQQFDGHSWAQMLAEVDARVGRTAAGGLDVGGAVQASSFTGSAAGLTNIPATSLTGTIDVARLPATVNAATWNGLTPAQYQTQLDGRYLAAGASIPATSLTGTIDAARLPSSLTALTVQTLQVGAAGTCSAAAEGQIRYVSATKKMEFCDGTQWKGMGGSSPLPSFVYRRPVTVGSPGASVTDAQVPVTLDVTGLVASGKMRADCGDLRFTAGDGTTLRPFWIESCGSTSVKAWVRAGDLTTSGQSLYVYYGNSGASSLSSGSGTFLLFDDFNDGDVSDWSRENASISAAVHDGKQTMYYVPGTSQGGYRDQDVYKLVALPSRHTVEASIKDIPNPTNNYPGGLMIAFQDTSNWIAFEGSTPGGSWTERGEQGGTDTGWISGYPSSPFANSTWQLHRLDMVGDGTYKLWLDSSLHSTKTHPRSSFAFNGTGFAKHADTGSAYLDWIRARAYLPTEPAVTVGAEQGF